MNAAKANTNQLTHRLASEIHRVIAARRMTAEQLAAQMVESPAFIRRVLIGENSIGKAVHLDFVQAVADATGRSMILKISPQRSVRRTATVETGDA